MLDDLPTVRQSGPSTEGGAVASNDLVFDDRGEGSGCDLAQEGFGGGTADHAIGFVRSAVLPILGPFGILASQVGSDPVDAIEQTVTAGNSSLTYDATAQQYVYVWKTDKAWAGTYREFQFKLIDGTAHSAYFYLTK